MTAISLFLFSFSKYLQTVIHTVNNNDGGVLPRARLRIDAVQEVQLLRPIHQHSKKLISVGSVRIHLPDRSSQFDAANWVCQLRLRRVHPHTTDRQGGGVAHSMGVSSEVAIAIPQ